MSKQDVTYIVNFLMILKLFFLSEQNQLSLKGSVALVSTPLAPPNLKNFNCLDEIETEIIKEKKNSHFKSKFCSMDNSLISCKNSSFPNNNSSRKKKSFKFYKTTFAVKFNSCSHGDPLVDVVPLILSSENLSLLLPNNIIQENGIQTLFKFISPNTTFYSVFGFDYDTDQNLNLSVQFNETFTDNQVVSETVQAIKNTNLKEQETTYIQNVSLICVFVDTTKDGFSDNGCESKFSSFSNNITCDCNHATVFTIILSVSLTTVPKSVQVRYFIYFLMF